MSGGGHRCQRIEKKSCDLLRSIYLIVCKTWNNVSAKQFNDDLQKKKKKCNNYIK